MSSAPPDSGSILKTKMPCDPASHVSNHKGISDEPTDPSLPQGQPVFHTARGSMYPRPARLRPCAAQPHKGSAPRNITSAPRPPPCRMTMRRGLVAPGSLRSRLRRSRYFSTLFCNRALIHSECHQKILWLPLLSVCFNPQSAHPPTDSAADGQGSCGLHLPEGRGCGKGFHRLRRRVNSSFPPEGGGLKPQRNF